MTSTEKKCGTCKWWARRADSEFGICEFRLPASLPRWVRHALARHTELNGTAVTYGPAGGMCECWEARQ